MGEAGLIAADGTITDPYRNFIAVSRYARWREDLGRRETWAETVTRYVDFFREHLAERHGYDPDAPIFDTVHEAILTHEVMPSMRALMTAGPALKRSHIAGYNCLRGSERFMTEAGLRTFADAAQDGFARVLNGKGEWTDAEVKEFGVQSLQRVTFRPGHQSRTSLRHHVDVTPDHRWVTTNRGEVTDLRVGDEVAFVGPRHTRLNRSGWIAGFGFGDGTINVRGQAQIRLCGDKNQFLDIFAYDGPADTRPNVSTPASYGGDHHLVFPRGTFDTWKTLPDEASRHDPDYIASWINGYIAADGSHKGDGLFELSSQDSSAIDFVKEWAPYAGLIVVGHNILSNLETNFGPRSAPLQKLILRKSGVFRVTAIEDLDLEEPVYCAIVPDGHEFVLANGIHTGNCSFIAVDSPDAFHEAMYVLMNGTGVGFSVEANYVQQLPRVPEQLVPAGHTITVEDSKEGWAIAFSFLLQELWHGFRPEWDLSLVRPAGAKLKTFGGRASGPDPLQRLFTFTVELFASAPGRQLTPIECHDLMCMVGDVVVSGGVRRSALISLSDLEDQEMATAKSGTWWEATGHRRLANNTAVYHETPSATAFKQEWQNLIDSGSGERGIYNLEGIRAHANEQGRDGSRIAGTNPCLTGDTVIATIEGPRTFADLAESGEDVQVYSWHPQTKKPVVRWMRRPHRTGVDVPILKVTFDSGLVVRCTPNHGFYSFRGVKIAAQDLQVGQSIRAFSASRDSSGHERIHGWDSQRNAADHQWTHRMIWENLAGPIPEGYVVAHLDGDGANNDPDNLSLMSDLGHRRYDMPKRQLAGMDGHSPNHKVIAVEPDGYADVYNGMVEDSHTYIVLDADPIAGHMSGVVSANCGEILLRANEFCNLTEVVIRPDDTDTDINRKIRLATIMGTWQSTLTDFQHLRPQWRANCEEERLLGVSLTGIYGHTNYNNPYDPQLPARLASMRETAHVVNIRESGRLGIAASAAITCVKPSGTVSQLTGVSSGIHPWHSQYYLRTVRGSNSDPLSRMLSDYQVPHEPDLMDPDVTTVFSFPVAAPAGAVTREQVTALDQLRLWSAYRQHFTDHNPSVTISVRSHEWDEVGEWVYENWDQVGGVSFLPYSEHTYQQAPYTDCDEATYALTKAAMPNITWSDLSYYEQADTTTSSQELACVAGACEVVDLRPATPPPAIPVLNAIAV